MLKSVIRKARESFTRTCTIFEEIDPDRLNNFFATTAQRTLDSEADTLDSLQMLIDGLTEEDRPMFSLREFTRAEVLKVLRSLRSDSSTGPYNIPVKFVKLVSDIIAGPLTAIINNCIRKCISLMHGSSLELVLFQKLISRLLRIISEQYPFYQRFLKYTRNLFP